MVERIQRYIYLYFQRLIFVLLISLLLFFVSPIAVAIIWIFILHRYQFRTRALIIIFVLLNIVISIFCILSVLFWIWGVIHDFSFSYVLYNLIRCEWTYITPIWFFFITFGTLGLIRVKSTWEQINKFSI